MNLKRSRTDWNFSRSTDTHYLQPFDYSTSTYIFQQNATDMSALGHKFQTACLLESHLDNFLIR